MITEPIPQFYRIVKLSITFKRAVLSARGVMLENQARYVIIGAEGSSEHGWEQRSLIEKIVRDSRGWIDVIVMLMNKKMTASNGGDGIEPERVADAATSIAEATLAVRELFGSRKFDEIDLEVQGGRHLIIRRYGGYHIAALTKPNPNLGLIKQAFRRNLESSTSHQLIY